jgi:type IV secretion system protein VirD4
MDKDDSKNRILSQNVRMSLDTRHTKLNNNVLIIGGSGAGKTFYEVKPNLMQRNSSFIITDPKGEILRSEGEMLKANGYNVKVINLLEMDKSDCYNPFVYLREEADVVKLVTNLMSNTTPKNASSSDPFWDKAEGMFLQSLFYYVWLETPIAKRNMSTVMELIAKAEVTEKDQPSELDKQMSFLEHTSPLGENHPAVKQYKKCMRGAGDTVRSIIISANSRLAKLENKQVLRLLSKDDLNLAELGTGVGNDGQTKTALFCVIPDSDKSYNFIIGMLYTQIFQELYYQADFNYGGRLPVHVTFMLDEFSNVALPDDYCSLLSTMRSREISSVIIIQNLAQIKALFKDTWETIPGNCDTLVYLGGNEQSTHEYISKLLGKATIDKKSTGESRGRQGSSSRNFDVLGREIMTPDEVRKMDNSKCLIFIRGLDPVLDGKYDTPKHPVFSQTADGDGKPYEYEKKTDDHLIGRPYEILNGKGVEHYVKMKENGGNVFIQNLSYEEFMRLDQDRMNEYILTQEEICENRRYLDSLEGQMEMKNVPDAEQVEQETKLLSDLIRAAKKSREKEEMVTASETLEQRLKRIPFPAQILRLFKQAQAMKIPEEEILKFAYEGVSMIQLGQFVNNYQSDKRTASS